MQCGTGSVSLSTRVATPALTPVGNAKLRPLGQAEVALEELTQRLRVGVLTTEPGVSDAMLGADRLDDGHHILPEALRRDATQI